MSINDQSRTVPLLENPVDAIEGLLNVQSMDVEVHEDPDQEGMFYYTSPGGGSDISYPSEGEAWLAAINDLLLVQTT